MGLLRFYRLGVRLGVLGLSRVSRAGVEGLGLGPLKDLGFRALGFFRRFVPGRFQGYGLWTQGAPNPQLIFK